MTHLRHPDMLQFEKFAPIPLLDHRLVLLFAMQRHYLMIAGFDAEMLSGGTPMANVFAPNIGCWGLVQDVKR